MKNRESAEDKQMEKWLLLVESDCRDQNREKEFDDWYDNIHIPDVLKDSPGFLRATRYVAKDPIEKGSGKYLALYEIETTDINRTIMAHTENMKNKKQIERLTDLLQIVNRRFCKILDP